MGDDDIRRIYDKLDDLSGHLTEVSTNQKWVRDAVEKNGDKLTYLANNGPTFCARGQEHEKALAELQQRMPSKPGNGGSKEPWFKFGFGKASLETHGSLALQSIVAIVVVIGFMYLFTSGHNQRKALDVLLQLNGVDVTRLDETSKNLTREAQKP